MNGKKKKTLNFPCQCGHSKKMHVYAGTSIGDEWCNGSDGKTSYKIEKHIKLYICPCEKYIPDNLKFLEKCFKNKGKKKK